MPAPGRCAPGSGAPQNWTAGAGRRPGNPGGGRFRSPDRVSLPARARLPSPHRAAPAPCASTGPHARRVWEALGPGARPSVLSPPVRTPGPRRPSARRAYLMVRSLDKFWTPWGVYTVSLPSQAEHLSRKTMERSPSACCRDRSRVGGRGDTPARTRAQVHLSGRTRPGRLPCTASCSGALTSLAIAGGDARLGSGIKNSETGSGNGDR